MGNPQHYHLGHHPQRLTLKAPVLDSLAQEPTMSTTMTHKRLVAAFTKAGCEVKNVPRFMPDSQGNKESHTWEAKNPKTGKSVTWYTQAAFVPGKDGKPATWDETNPVTTHVTWHSPHTDIQTDCFCDSYYHTIKSAVAAIA